MKFWATIWTDNPSYHIRHCAHIRTERVAFSLSNARVSRVDDAAFSAVRCWFSAGSSWTSRLVMSAVPFPYSAVKPGAQPRLKSWGDQGLGPSTGALSGGCGWRSPPPPVRVQGYHPRKIFENLHAKSCILATTCCEISCFLKTTAKKLGGPIHC